MDRVPPVTAQIKYKHQTLINMMVTADSPLTEGNQSHKGMWRQDINYVHQTIIWTIVV